MDGERFWAKDNIMIKRFYRGLKYNEIYINDYDSLRETQQGMSGFYLLNYTPAAVYNKKVHLWINKRRRGGEFVPLRALSSTYNSSM
ncbi:hypothetical protein [Paenibacillus sp. S150]|uniref:hypothetical protein n=1 Tax=Paenibacillus sp. S150 TaxID=2749826 RepID=UPI001C58F072|nr:hypothetical protein [Paenibacillus sp. S150]MBW4085270.1 hypothetical protein [Paenibacillus sp. S150]